MESASQAKTSARIHWMRAFFVSALVVLALGACKRNETGQLPEPSGEPIKTQKEEIKGFALASAYPDQHDGDLSIALEFSRPLVGSQAFDDLLVVTDDKGQKTTVILGEMQKGVSIKPSRFSIENEAARRK